MHQWLAHIIFKSKEWVSHWITIDGVHLPRVVNSTKFSLFICHFFLCKFPGDTPYLQNGKFVYKKISPYVSPNAFPYLSLTSLFSSRKITPLLIWLFVKMDEELSWSISRNNSHVYLLLEVSISFLSLQLKSSSFTIWFSKCQ